MIGHRVRQLELTVINSLSLSHRWLMALGVAVLLTLFGSAARAQAAAEVDVATAAAQIREKHVKVLDVREPSEFATGVIQGALLIPLGQVEKRVAELSELKDQPLYVICASGGRSAQAIKTLSKLGFTQLTNVKGGMNAWRKMDLPVVAP
jgi:rhodanese-related sulfurtransferase